MDGKVSERQITALGSYRRRFADVDGVMFRKIERAYSVNRVQRRDIPGETAKKQCCVLERQEVDMLSPAEERQPETEHIDESIDLVFLVGVRATEDLPSDTVYSGSLQALENTCLARVRSFFGSEVDNYFSIKEMTIVQ